MYRTIIYALACVLLYACSSTGSDHADAVPSINVAANQDTDSEPLAVSNLSATQLDSDNREAFFSSAAIIDVVGDTIVLLEGAPFGTRLIMFDLGSGKYLGQISHIGQGPGEYRFINSAFIDKSNHTALLPDFDKPIVNVYSLPDDTLANVLGRPDIFTTIEPSGSADVCINIAQMGENALKITQCDRTYAVIDSIVVPDFHGNNFSKCWMTSDGKGLLVSADTLYYVMPGNLQPIAAVSCGEQSLTPEKEREVMEQIINGSESEPAILKPYTIVRDIQVSGDKLLLTTMHDEAKMSDVYDLATGNLIYRHRYDDLSTPNRIVVSGTDGNRLSVERLHAKAGKWYGIVSESDDSDSNQNVTLVSFSL